MIKPTLKLFAFLMATAFFGAMVVRCGWDAIGAAGEGKLSREHE